MFFVAEIYKPRSALVLRDIWRSPLARQLLPPCYQETYISIFVSFFGLKKLTSGQIKEESVDQVVVTMSDSVSDLACVRLL